MGSTTERMTMTASCSVNEDKVEELSTRGEFTKRSVFCARLEALRDLCPDFPFKAGSTTYC